MWNAEKRYQGRRSDLPLSAEGEKAIKQINFTVSRVFVSPLLRVRQSAARLFPRARQEVVADFAEFDFGAFEGRNYSEMEHDAAYRAWVDGGCVGRCPGGEDRAAFCARVCKAFEELLSTYVPCGAEPLVIVAHSGTLRAILERFALPRREYFSWEAPCGGGFALGWDEALWRSERSLRWEGEAPC